MSTPTTEQSFRTNLSQFRWARGVTDDSQQAQAAPAAPASNNPFARFYSTISNHGNGYVPLRRSADPQEEAWFALNRWERLLGFAACLAGAAVCFLVAFMTLPLLALRPAKFALAFSLGSLLVMFGFSVLIGPIVHLKHLISKDRLPFSLTYFASLALTLYFSLGVMTSRSFHNSWLNCVLQIVALVSYIAAYFPGGTQTLRLGGSLALSGASSLLPR
ncbi:SFT2-domain-containing protein [Fistulina hepatica ATCC 64428]|uniref:Protein transport protein SFT2 n=1 Tax=Fistulina hepatica ATCC 64428 TaxID=1128425 RepID=A0A0D7ACZ7_9AGAR|nr:SFT2-domain-containing protein [Fistulina hepatica ATCC 64428]